ncbi:unnamed protein product, partial [Rotaria magnacalcarata]
MEDITNRVHHENEQIQDGNNHLHMGVQTLKKKEQQHAFQHATSAEIIQLLANMLQNQEEIIVRKQEEIAQVDVAERRIKELRTLIFNNEKNYPEIRQENKSFNEKLDELNKLVGGATKDKAIILSNLRRAVLLVTESLKIKDEEKALVPIEQAGQTINPETDGNLFQQLHNILTSTEEIDVDEQQQQQSSLIDITRSTLNLKDPGKRRDNLSYSLGDIGFVPRRDAVL